MTKEIKGSGVELSYKENFQGVPVQKFACGQGGPSPAPLNVVLPQMNVTSSLAEALFPPCLCQQFTSGLANQVAAPELTKHTRVATRSGREK